MRQAPPRCSIIRLARSKGINVWLYGCTDTSTVIGQFSCSTTLRCVKLALKVGHDADITHPRWRIIPRWNRAGVSEAAPEGVVSQLVALFVRHTERRPVADVQALVFGS